MSINTWLYDPANPLRPDATVRMFVTGPSIAYLTKYRVWRYVNDSTYEPMPSVYTANKYPDNTPVLVIEDWLYPLDTPYVYQLMAEDNTTLLDVSPPAPITPSGGTPWIRDVLYPSGRAASVTIVDITDRLRAGRVSAYYQAAQPFPVVLGDVRSASSGTITLLCRSHAERDMTIAAMSTGSPVQLRVPKTCTSVVDEMHFTPVDIDETRFGTRGACVLAVDFIEVKIGDLPAFQAISYAIQTQNALAAGFRYAELTRAFATYTYQDMTMSPTGIAP